MHPDWFTNEFKRQARAAGLTGLRGPHGLRHTWATLALQTGIHPKVVSERLGQSTISITLDTYSHVMPAARHRGRERRGGEDLRRAQ